MNRFLNLSTRVLNKYYIVEIVKEPRKYIISTSYKEIHGFMLFSIGNLSSKQQSIEICETNHKEDYDKITEFIQNIK